MEKAIGIDLGGTKVFGGIIDRKGNILRKATRDTFSSQGRKEIIYIIRDLIEDLLEDDTLGIGIGSPGFIDNKNGRVLKVGGNIKGWANTNIKYELKNFFPNHSIFIENDANVAAICEHWLGAAKNLKSFLMITLGTGVGGAVFLKNVGILRGENYQGAEFGHSILYPYGEECPCGQYGCVERYISGTAIERIYREKSGKYKMGKDIFQDNDDIIAKEVVDDFAKNLGVFLVSLKNLFDPDGIIIGGGVINSKEFWWDNSIEYYKKFSNDPYNMNIKPAIYSNDAGMIGAGKIVFDNIKIKNKNILL